jgi:hypothetical protein
MDYKILNMSWFKQDKYERINKNKEIIKFLLDFSEIEKMKILSDELDYLEIHPEIPKRPHPSPEYRIYLAKIIELHNKVKLEDIKEDEETPEWIKAKRRLEKKYQ